MEGGTDGGVGDLLNREYSDTVGLVSEMDLHTQLSPELSPEDPMLGIDNVGLDFAELDLIMSGEDIQYLPDSPPDSSSDGCITSPQYEGYDGSTYPTTQDMMGYRDPPLYSHSHFTVRHPSLHDRVDLHTVDYTQPHQLVEQGQQFRVKEKMASLPTRLTVRGVTNNNLTVGRQTALCPREEVPHITVQDNLGVIKQEPLPSPPVPPARPGPGVKKRRRDNSSGTEEVRVGVEIESGAAVKCEGETVGETLNQTVQFVAFQPSKWSQSFTQSRVKLPTPLLKVSADKGFNYSSLDDAFIAQKKNHFQLTCHVVKEGVHEMVSTETGFKPVEYLQLNFYGVKSEAQEQRIQIEQSQTDRSRKRFFPIKLSFRGDQPLRASVGRLHFSETTLNNMRKKGRPNPEQRYFQLVVALEAVIKGPAGSRIEIPLFCLATERIIVRASNPGLFEPDQEVSWSKQGASDTVYHMGKVGIGTDYSTEALTVQGNIQVSGEVLHPSDRRIKTKISPVETKQQLQNIQNVQVVEYQYKPEYLERFSPTQREQMGRRQTGVIAQDLKKVLPDAVESAGDISLPDGEVEGMLIVNKDRLFLENVGAVRELSKVTDNLGHRIEELESYTVRMTRLTRFGSVKSSGSLSTSSSSCQPKSKRSSKDGGLFRSRWMQGAILMLLAVMTVCLVSIATIYIVSYLQRKAQSEVSYNTTTTMTPPASSSRTTTPTVHPNNTTFTPTSPVTKRNTIISSTTVTQGIDMTTTRARPPKTFHPIGKPHNCEAPDVPDITCPTYCCISDLPSQDPQPSLVPVSDYPSLDDNTISSPGPEAAGRGREEERDTVREAARREQTQLLEEELEQMSYSDRELGDINQGGEEGDVGVEEGEGVQEVPENLHRSDDIANADTDLYSSRPGHIASFIQDPKQGEQGGLKESSRHRPITHSQAPLPRTGRDESESISKKELSPQNQIQLSVNIKPDKEEEEEDNKVDLDTGDNSTSQEDWIGSGRKSTKSVLSSVNNNNVVIGSDKISPREGKNSSSRRNLGLRKRRAVEDIVNYKPEDTYGEAGCGLRYQIHVHTGTGLVNLSEEYCTGCDSRGYNCSYLVPLSEHMPDSNISLLLPITAVSCPISSLTPPILCPQVNEIEEVEQQVLNESEALSFPSNLQTFTEDVRTRLSIQLQYRIPETEGTQDIQDICSVPGTHLGTKFTQINIRVKRNCGE